MQHVEVISPASIHQQLLRQHLSSKPPAQICTPVCIRKEDPCRFCDSQPLPAESPELYRTGNGVRYAEVHALSAAGSSQEEGAEWPPAWGGRLGPGAAGGGAVHRQHCRHSSSHPVQVNLLALKPCTLEFTLDRKGLHADACRLVTSCRLAQCPTYNSGAVITCASGFWGRNFN